MTKSVLLCHQVIKHLFFMIMLSQTFNVSDSLTKTSEQDATMYHIEAI